MKKVMVLGAGRGQLPLIKLFHKYGCYVITVSPEGNYPGFDEADETVYLDVQDKEKILESAIKYDICAITTDQLDEGVPTAAYVSEKMNIPGIGYDIALKFTNKQIMRKCAKEAGINVPKSFQTDSIKNAKRIIESDDELIFPLIIKPVDSSASRGIYKLNSLEDLDMYFDSSVSYSKNRTVIIEQFITGKEFVVDAYTSNYKVNNLIVGHRDYFDIPDTFIPCATLFTDSESAISNIEKELKQINDKLITSFGLPFGITHAEYLYDEKAEKIYLVEIAARGGGVFISSDLIPLASGINANELLVKELLGLNDDLKVEVKSGSSAYFCYLTPEGTVCKIEGTENINKINGVYNAYFDNIELNMKVNSIRDKSSRKGPIIVNGNTKCDCYNVIKQVKEVLDIKVDTIDGVKDIIWN